jgi:signal transduction histidine kinase
MIFRPNRAAGDDDGGAQAPLARAHLVLLTGLGAGRIWPITDEVIVGRGSDVQAVLHDTEVSRRHLRLTFDGLTCRFQDLGSVNGTLLNEERITDQSLHAMRDGDQLRLGPITCLQFRLTVDAGQVGKRLGEVFQQLQTAMTELEVAKNASAGRDAQGALLSRLRSEMGGPLRAVAGDLEFAIAELPRLAGEPSRLTGILRAVSDALLGVAHVRRMVGDAGPEAAAVEEQDTQEVEVNQLVDSALAACSQGGRLRLQILKELGPPQAVRGSAARLQPVIVQLVLEAIRAVSQLPPEQAVIRVRTRVSRTAAAIEVQDTGLGYSAEEMEAMLSDRPPTVPAPGGRGLTLRRCREAITAAEGELRMVSDRGKGTAFQVLLRKAHTEDQRQEVTNPAIQLRRGRVLFLPGEPAAVDLVVRSLRGEHDVMVAYSLAEAIAALRAPQPFDLVVVDLFADAGAIAFHDRTLQELGGNAPGFIFLIPESPPPVIGAFLARVAGDRLSRPVDSAKLRALVRARLV